MFPSNLRHCSSRTTTVWGPHSDITEGWFFLRGQRRENMPRKHGPSSSLAQGQKHVGFLRAGWTPCGLQQYQASVQPLSCVLLFSLNKDKASAALPSASSLCFPYFSSCKIWCIRRMKFPEKSLFILFFWQAHSSCFLCEGGLLCPRILFSGLIRREQDISALSLLLGMNSTTREMQKQLGVEEREQWQEAGLALSLEKVSPGKQGLMWQPALSARHCWQLGQKIGLFRDFFFFSLKTCLALSHYCSQYLTAGPDFFLVACLLIFGQNKNYFMCIKR